MSSTPTSGDVATAAASSYTLDLEIAEAGTLVASWKAPGSGAALGPAELRPAHVQTAPEGMHTGEYVVLNETSIAGQQQQQQQQQQQPSESKVDSGEEQLWFVFFHIKEQRIDDFKNLLLEECRSVLVSEPENLRYDLLQSQSDPRRFLVVELVANSSAMQLHESRRSDGTMRSALAEMEEVSRKSLPGTAQWLMAGRSLRDLAWPQQWRKSTARTILCDPLNFFGAASAPLPLVESEEKQQAASAQGSQGDPLFLAALAATRDRRLREWVGSVLPPDDPVVQAEFSGLDKMGGMQGTFTFLSVTYASGKSCGMVLKTAQSAPMRTAMGQGREAFFYKKVVPKFLAAGVAVPRCYYADGDMQSGEVVLLLELLNNSIPSGVLFGAAQPNNWEVEKTTGIASLCAGNPSPDETVTRSFVLYARLHAEYWCDVSLFEEPWLRGAQWYAGENRQSWEGAEAWATRAWPSCKNVDIQWDPHLVASLDAAMNRVDWAAYQAEIKGRPFCLVHGDAHAHNIMLVEQRSADARLCLIDFEVVGIGSNAQELGQYAISHCPPELRREREREWVQTYHTELCQRLEKCGRSEAAASYTFDDCFAEYVAGGIARWAWFLPMFSGNPAILQFFHDQLAAFLRDHLTDPANCPMPRV